LFEIQISVKPCCWSTWESWQIRRAGSWFPCSSTTRWTYWNPENY